MGHYTDVSKTLDSSNFSKHFLIKVFGTHASYIRAKISGKISIQV